MWWAIFIVSVIAFVLILRWRMGMDQDKEGGWRDGVTLAALIGLGAVFMIQKAMVDGMSLTFAVVFTFGFIAFMGVAAAIGVHLDRRRAAKTVPSSGAGDSA